MNQQESEALAQFCAEQYYAFDSRAWLRRSMYDRHASNVAAMYLSMTSWYGHEEELERIAADAGALHASGEERRLASRSAPATIDPARFSAMVRAEIEMRRAGRAAEKPARENRHAAA